MARYGRWQKPTVMRKYPHLLTLDGVCWSRFLEKSGSRIRRVQYDVWCGTPMEWPEGSTPIPGQSEGCGCKRVDAIFEDTGGHLHICEVKPYGNYVALGQVQMYADLMCHECGQIHKATSHIVCFSADPDILDLAMKHKIEVNQVGFPPVV